MYKKAIIFLVFTGLILSLVCACGPKVIEKKLGDIQIEILEPASLKDKALKQWYEEFYQEKFNHDVSHIDGYRYVLICAGEAPTGGYSIELLNARQENGTLLFNAKVIGPKEGENVSQGITYPNILFRFKETNEVNIRVELDMEGIDGIDSAGPDEFKGIAGVYIGLADRNFVEIAVDKTVNFPGNENTIVFKLSDKVKQYFDVTSSEYKNISNDDPVKFDCIKNEQGQWEITEIQVLSQG